MRNRPSVGRHSAKASSPPHRNPAGLGRHLRPAARRMPRRSPASLRCDARGASIPTADAARRPASGSFHSHNEVLGCIIILMVVLHHCQSLPYAKHGQSKFAHQDHGRALDEIHSTKQSAVRSSGRLCHPGPCTARSLHSEARPALGEHMQSGSQQREAMDILGLTDFWCCAVFFRCSSGCRHAAG